MYDYRPLKTIATVKFHDIVTGADVRQGRVLRLFIRDGSHVDIFYSPRERNRNYAYHWERRMLDGTIYRHDNVPDGNWAHLKTFPKHCHEGQENRVRESSLSDDPESAIREFLTVVRERLSSNVTE